MTMPSTPWSRTSGLALALALAGLAVTVPAPLTSRAQLTDTRSVDGNTVSTRAACPGPPLFPAAVLAAAPTFSWRFAEPDPVTTVIDATGDGPDGVVVGGAGLTFGPATAGLIQCEDTHGLALDGQPTSDGFVVQPTAVPNPDTFTISAWVQSGSTGGGWVLGMGSARWGVSSQRDRVLFVDANGQPAFAVGIAPRTILTGPVVTDGQPHLLVGTLGSDGMALYVDGLPVASDSGVTAGAQYTGSEPTDPPPAVAPPTPDGHGYWRAGYDATADLGPAAPTHDQFDGRVDEVAVWEGRALSATEVADLYAQNHW